MEAGLCDRRVMAGYSPELANHHHDQLLRRVFQMCDVHRRGHISVDDLLELGQSYLGQDTKVSIHFYDVV